MRIVVSKVPDAEGWLIGPEDEDPDYTQECKALLKSFGLDNSVRFLGFQSVEKLLPEIGITVLTSVSEGQPLVTLEGFAAGIPTVTTDVGSCSELIHGADDEDRAIGSAGSVVPIANPAMMADEIISLLTDRDKWQRASHAAVTRVEKYYDEKDMLIRYRDIYEHNIDLSRRANMPKAEGF